MRVALGTPAWLKARGTAISEEDMRRIEGVRETGQAIVAAEVDGQVSDAARPLAELSQAQPIPLRLLTEKDPASLGVMRHSCAHIMARAVMRLFPGVSLAFGPTIGNGFYYDFDLEHKLNEEDFPKIEAEMQRIATGRYCRTFS